MLENMALVSLPGTVNSGLCGKATFGTITLKGVDLGGRRIIKKSKEPSRKLLSHA